MNSSKRLKLLNGAESRNRTGTGAKSQQILSLLRLPVPPYPHKPDRFNRKKDNLKKMEGQVFFLKERKKICFYK